MFDHIHPQIVTSEFDNFTGGGIHGSFGRNYD